MGRRGPPKKPTALKKAQGQRKRDMPKNEPMPPEVKKPETTLELSKRANVIFDELCKRLSEVGLLTTLDVQTVTRYCDLFDKWIIYRDEVDRAPMVESFSESGVELKPNPATKTYLSLTEKLLKIEQQFGMTPAARAAIGSSISLNTPIKEDETKKDLYGD